MPPFLAHPKVHRGERPSSQPIGRRQAPGARAGSRSDRESRGTTRRSSRGRPRRNRVAGPPCCGASRQVGLIGDLEKRPFIFEQQALLQGCATLLEQPCQSDDSAELGLKGSSARANSTTACLRLSWSASTPSTRSTRVRRLSSVVRISLPMSSPASGKLQVDAGQSQDPVNAPAVQGLPGARGELCVVPVAPARVVGPEPGPGHEVVEGFDQVVEHVPIGLRVPGPPLERRGQRSATPMRSSRTIGGSTPCSESLSSSQPAGKAYSKYPRPSKSSMVCKNQSARRDPS